MIFPPLKYGSNGGIFYIEAKEDTMKRGEIVTGKVERTDYPSKGIVRVDSDNTLSVKNVLPGQTVSVRVKKVRGGKGEGSLIEVIKPADNEITPPCESFGICGGCAYMNLSYEDQLKLKEGQVLKLIKSVRGLEDIDDGRWQGIKGSPAHLGYRNKMEYTFGDEYKDGPLSLGLHKRGSFYDVVSAGGCKICDEDYGLIVNETLDFFKEKGISYYHRLRHEGYLRHLMVRKAFHTDEIMVAIVTTTQLDFDMEQYKDMLLGLSDKGVIEKHRNLHISRVRNLHRVGIVKAVVSPGVLRQLVENIRDGIVFLIVFIQELESVGLRLHDMEVVISVHAHAIITMKRRNDFPCGQHIVVFVEKFEIAVKLLLRHERADSVRHDDLLAIIVFGNECETIRKRLRSVSPAQRCREAVLFPHLIQVLLCRDNDDLVDRRTEPRRIDGVLDDLLPAHHAILLRAVRAETRPDSTGHNQNHIMDIGLNHFTPNPFIVKV